MYLASQCEFPEASSIIAISTESSSVYGVSMGFSQMNCEKNTVACRDLASFAMRSVLLASGGFIAMTAAAQD